MKAVVYTKYGSPNVLQIKDVERPVSKDNEVLIKVCAASVNPYDLHFMTGEAEQTGLDHHWRAGGGRKANAGDRQALQLK
jgi:NADPH:quinone reductase-like Zn-dependent oxidoreductase